MTTLPLNKIENRSKVSQDDTNSAVETVLKAPFFCRAYTAFTAFISQLLGLEWTRQTIYCLGNATQRLELLGIVRVREEHITRWAKSARRYRTYLSIYYYLLTIQWEQSQNSL